MLLKNAETHQRTATRAHREDRLAGRRRFLIDLGVASESQINRRVTDPDGPLPSTPEQMERQASDEREKRMQKPQRQREQEKARKAFSNPWLVRMEAEMAECNRRLEGTKDAEMRAVLTSLLEINSNKLRVFHQNQGTLGKQEALAERKKSPALIALETFFSLARDSPVGQGQFREQQCQSPCVVHPTGKRGGRRQL